MIQNTENSKERISIPQNPNTLTIRKNDRNKIIFGSVLTLYTFDRDLKWNPHILCLVCEEAFDTQKNKMKNFLLSPMKSLERLGCIRVLDLLSKQKIKNFRYLKQKLYEELVNGFYVYAKREKKNDDDCVNYITRYTSRPPMAENHIIKYEDDKKIIKWWYNRHEDEEYVEVYEKVEDFINNLILHCPDENFKMVRYYGFYSNKNKPLLEKVYELYGIKKKKHIKNLKERKKT